MGGLRAPPSRPALRRERGERLDGDVPQRPERDCARRQRPYPPMGDERPRRGRQPERAHRRPRAGVRDERKRHHRQRVVPNRRRDVPAHKRVERPKRPATRAVKPSQPEERADGIDALNARVNEIDDRQPQRGNRRQRNANQSRMPILDAEQSPRRRPRGYGDGQFGETENPPRALSS